MLDSLSGRLDGFFGRFIAIVVWAEGSVVHANTPDESTLTVSQTEIGEQVGSLNVSGGEVSCRSGAMRQSTADTSCVYAPGLFKIIETGFKGKCVLV
jgi:hypothetical protein